MHRSILLIFMLLLLVMPAQTHDYHTSLTEIRFNPKSKTLQAAVKVFADDLEKALSEKHKTNVVLNRSEKTEALVGSYLKTNLTIKNEKGQQIELNYIGREAENDVAWLYLESAEVAASDLKKLTVKNTILTEIFNDQMNIVTLEVPGRKSSFLFSKDQPRHIFE